MKTLACTKPKKSTTIADVAEAAGVTHTTVSNVLNGRGKASAQTRDAVLAAVEKLGYEGNFYAQRLKSRCPRTIGLFHAGMDRGVGSQTVEEIQHRLNDLGFDVPIYGSGLRESHKPETQLELMRGLRRQRLRAIICHSYNLSQDAIAEMSRYQEEGGISVYYGQPLDVFGDQVIFDEEDNTYQAARHLLELGHQRIGFCHSGKNKPQHPRVRGLRRALHEQGLTLNEEWVFYGEVYEEAGALLAKNFLKIPATERPTALCIVNDNAASTFVHEIMRAGVKVPGDISVVSHDDMPVARYAMVPLTAVSCPVKTIAEHVVEVLARRLDGVESDGFEKHIIRGELMVRSSTAPPSQ